MKKIYTVEITGCSKENIWYADKKGYHYEVELRCINHTTQHIVFSIGDNHKHIYLVDCKVVAEKNSEHI